MWHHEAKITNSTEAFVILGDGCFAHGRTINGEPSTLYEVPDLFNDVMANRTRIDEDHYVWTSFLREFLNPVKDKLFYMQICRFNGARKGCVQLSAGNFVEDQISREFKVHRPSLEKHGGLATLVVSRPEILRM